MLTRGEIKIIIFTTVGIIRYLGIIVFMNIVREHYPVSDIFRNIVIFYAICEYAGNLCDLQSGQNNSHFMSWAIIHFRSIISEN